MFFEIKVYMSAALGFYLLAFFSAKTRRKTHIFFAVCGFIFDLYATYLMHIGTEIALKNNFQFILHSHISFALLAIIAFLVQAALGIWKKKEAHIFSAKYVFLPLWIATYVSGLYLLFTF